MMMNSSAIVFLAGFLGGLFWSRAWRWAQALVILLFRKTWRGRTWRTSHAAPPKEEGETEASFLGAVPREPFFDVSHGLLNVTLPTWWLNLGYWEEGCASSKCPSGFVDACTALASQLGDSARLSSLDHVCDVGFGCGDQILHWRAKYGVTRVSGVNISRSQVAIAQRRLLGSPPQEWDCIDLRHGSATALSTEFPPCSFTKVLSLDSAYHYDTRASFLREAFAVLQPGGTLALADIVLSLSLSAMPLTRRAFVWAVCKGSHVPPSNLVTCPELVACLTDVGFAEISTRVIDEHVWSGFPRWLAGHEDRLSSLVLPDRWLRFRAVAWGLDFVDRTKVFHYVIVTAKKPSSSER